MRHRAALWATVAVVTGVVVGWQLGGRQIARSHEDLFHAQPLRRLAALNWLEESPEAATVSLVRDYLQWERQPLLRGRAQRLLRRLEATFA
jgi:hypothetical protein